MKVKNIIQILDNAPIDYVVCYNVGGVLVTMLKNAHSKTVDVPASIGERAEFFIKQKIKTFLMESRGGVI